MITRKLQLLLLFLMISLSTTVTAQKIIKKANKQFELKAYDEAYDTYVKALEKYPERNVLKLQIAECLRRTNRVLESKEWYEIAMTSTDVPVVYNLYFGHLLKNIAEYHRASLYYSKYKEVNTDIAEHFILSCDFALNLMREQSQYELILDECNSKQSDIAMKFYGDDMVFTSFRDNDPEAGVDGCRLYIKKEGVESIPLRSALKTQHGVGFISYAIEEELCAFTTSNVINNHKPLADKDEDYTIYFAQVIDSGDFINEVPFKYNEVNSSSAFPHLAFDGNVLYFSSNRQGGFGGYDLYVSYNKKGNWTEPENLGAEVNSAGNEITPFYDGANLYFASDYHAGMGGYDLFITDMVMGKWTYPLNLGNGINSPGDDYYPSLKQGNNILYFSSNRLGGRGSDDIYFGVPTKEKILYSINNIYNSVEVPKAIELDGKYAPSSNELAKVNNQSSLHLVADNEITNIKIISAKNPEAIARKSFVASKVDPTDVSTEILSIVGEKKLNDNHLDMIENTDLIEDSENRNDRVTTTAIAVEEQEVGVSIMVADNEELSRILAVPYNRETVAKIDKTSENKLPAKDEIVINQEGVTNVKINKLLSNEVITEISESKSLTSDISMHGAKRVSYGDLLPAASTAYFIQLASLSRSKGNVDDYKSLIKYGNIYKIYSQSYTKIKLGYFTDKHEAKKVLSNIKAQGYSDAFITSESLESADIELFIAGKEYNYNGSNYSSTKKQGTQYKVRLASYEDPIWFDIKTAKQLGEIEQWTKGEWTIFILSGFQDIEGAQSAKIRAINRGFADAEVVIDNGGILERIRTQ
tara:strand:- start:176 stop:2611 length:2436 start_codon:yes stop_codon:yes gene_type:complete